MGLALVSGINLYATILTVGLGIQFGFIHLPPELSALSVLGHPYVLMAASITYTLEFFADKIPWVDSLWDTFHTFIRPVGGALLGMKAVGAVDPVIELSVMLLCGGVAFLSHSAKASTRFVANHSPEPFTNIALSFGEDISVITGTWAALEYPVTMFVVTILFIAGFIFWAPKIFRLLRVEMLAILSLFQTFFDRNDISDDSILSDEIPDDLYAQIQADTAPEEKAFCIRCVSGKALRPAEIKSVFYTWRATGFRLSPGKIFISVKPILIYSGSWNRHFTKNACLTDWFSATDRTGYVCLCLKTVRIKAKGLQRFLKPSGGHNQAN